MYIEVTEKTFYLLFKKEPYKVEKEELFERHHYKSKRLNQYGYKVWNYASSRNWQYYLRDINA